MDLLNDPANGEHIPPAGSAREVFRAALGLGLTSFGGPVAHIGYFERAYVHRRQWLSADEFVGLVALCQLVPGPASSQLGYLIGLKQAGWAGACAAWLGFTLPSALAMFGLALLGPGLSGPVAIAVLHGLKLVAVVIVAQAIWTMARSQCADSTRAAIALAAGMVLIWPSWPGLQLPVLGVGAAIGAVLCRHVPVQGRAPSLPVGRRLGAVALGLFLGLLVLALPVERVPGQSLTTLAAIFYQSGALVFGGGHVVLPLLRGALVPAGWLGDGAFLAGYGAAQAMPGPLFTFAAYLGASVAPAHAGLAALALWSSTALLAIFLPGLLIAVTGASVWTWLGSHTVARGALAGTNAAVVGLLGAAFVTPVWTSAVRGVGDLAIVVALFIAMMRLRCPPVAIVVLCVFAAVAQAHIAAK